MPAAPAAGQVGDGGGADLDLRQGQPAQRGERAGAGAEVVDPDPHPLALELDQARLARGPRGGEHLLVDLDEQLPGREPAAASALTTLVTRAPSSFRPRR